MTKYLSWSGDNSAWDDGGFTISTTNSQIGIIFTDLFSSDYNPWGKTKTCSGGSTIAFNTDGTICVNYTLNGVNYNEIFQGTYGSSGDILTYLPQVLATAITGVTLSNDSPIVGEDITAVVTPAGSTVTWQWYRGVTEINGATGATYTPTSEDIGFILSATATGAGDSSGTATAATINAVDKKVLIILGGQIVLPVAASESGSPIRKSEFDSHLSDTSHLPSDGTTGQILVLTADGPAWKWASISGETITFNDTEPT